MKTEGFERGLQVIVRVVAVCVGVILAFMFYADYTGKIRTECVEHAKIESITKVDHRKVWYKLDNGKTVDESQPDNIYPGKEVCAEWKKVNEFLD